MFAFMLLIVLPFSIFAKEQNITVETGTNITLSSSFSNDPSRMPRLTWYKEDLTMYKGSYFAVKLCEFEPGKDKLWQHDIQFDCINKSLHLYNLLPYYSATYRVKVMNGSVEYNDIFNLEVINLPAPICYISSYYLTVQDTNTFCLIEINCTKSNYYNRIFFNGKYGNYHLTDYGGPNLPGYYNVTVRLPEHKLSHTYTFTYPFSELCQEIQSLESATDFTPIFIVVIVASIITIICVLSFYCCHKKKERQRFKKLKRKAVIEIA